MKLNWGHGLFIAIVIAVSGIVLLVVLSSREKIDLVSQEYYPEGLRYEDQIQKQKNSQLLTEQVNVYQSKDTILVCFPQITEYASQIKGEVWFYYPANIDRDVKMEISLDSNYCQVFSKVKFTPGKYSLIIDWVDGTNKFLHKEQLFIE